MSSLLSIPSSSSPTQSFPFFHSSRPSFTRLPTLLKPTPISSSSSPQPTLTGQGDSAPPPPLAPDVVPDGTGTGTSFDGSADLPFRGCKTCGREEIERGCNGEGRIQGGIATVPGFGWWPIKAYRPCPGFVASGGRYRRQGQSMDEVAFGRGEREASPKRTKVESR
ncbi:hypothetical protein QJS04_geneDACA012787 [Acorus gramineus]|uniref:Uncharacterized protein n=1 Tax=Acorus gramineus TaxID=55184 RepID=A0AAV9BK68_ACOGR|nr:hypothetical protein QJS04_geneDACA012787 [Acorus gramineus]